MPDRGVPIGDPVNNAAHVATPQWQSFETRMRHRRANRCLQRAAAAIESGQLAEASEALDEARELNPRAPELEPLLDRLAVMQAQPAAPLGAKPGPPLVVTEPPQPFVPPAPVTIEPEVRRPVQRDLNESLVDETVVPTWARTLNRPPQLDLEPVELEPVEPVDLHPLHAREPVDLHPLHAPELLPLHSPAPVESRSWLRATAVGCVAIGLSAFAGWLAVTQWPARVPASERRTDIPLPAVGRELVAPEAIPSAVLEEPVGTDVALESASADAPPVAVEPDREPDPAATPAAPREPAAASVTPQLQATVPRTEVESTSGRVPAPVVPPPAAPPPSAQPVPRIVDDAPRAPARTTATDTPTAPATLPPASASSLPASSTASIPAPSPPAVSESPPPPPVPEAAPRAAPPTVDDRAAVRATLSRYEAAYSDLDIAGARAVWPGVDQRALARAFEGLASQRVALGTCEVGVNGPSARAICVGNATWTPKVGGGRQTKSRTWTFDLRRADATWQIVKVDTR